MTTSICCCTRIHARPPARRPASLSFCRLSCSPPHHHHHTKRGVHARIPACLSVSSYPRHYPHTHPQPAQRLAESIAPSVSGDYTVDIKKALACQLMSGSRKVQNTLQTHTSSLSVSVSVCYDPHMACQLMSGSRKVGTTNTPTNPHVYYIHIYIHITNPHILLVCVCVLRHTHSSCLCLSVCVDEALIDLQRHTFISPVSVYEDPPPALPADLPPITTRHY